MIGIYVIINIINNKVYIGQSFDIVKRWKGHKHSLCKNKHVNEYLQRAWNKYGENNFNFIILEECDLQQLNDREKYWIEFYKSYEAINGYNQTLGGDFGKLSKEAKKKISESKKGEKHPLYGKTLSDEYKQKISESTKGSKNGFYGKNHNNTTKQKISQINKGSKHSEETKQQISNTLKQKCSNENIRKKMSERQSGENNSRFKHFTIEEIQDICMRLKNKETLKSISERYNCCKGPIIRISDQYGGMSCESLSELKPKS